MKRYLEPHHVDTILRDQLNHYGRMYGARDHTLLESAVAVARAGFGGELLHKSVVEQAAAYLFHLCRNHPYIDGNKRVYLVRCNQTFQC